MSSLTQELPGTLMAPTSVGRNALVGRILVVDDEPELRSVLVDSIQRHGYEVIGCGSGDKALAELRKRDYDLLLTDLMMPKLDGIALLKAALEIDPHLVGIILTGQGTIQTAVDAMQMGAFDYVLKPFRMQTLMPVLTRAMNVRHLKLENVQLRETVAIHSLCQTIAFTLDPQTVLSKLADAALQQSDADEVSILLPTSDGTELYVAAVRGPQRERLLGQRVPFEKSISSWVARERLPLILNGEVRDKRFVAFWPRPDIRSAVSVPMQVSNKLVGIINLNVTDRLRPFTLGQMKALGILAGTAAAALESASLYAQVQQVEKNYRSLFENAVEGIFQSTSDRRLLTVNPPMASILGYDSPEEVINSLSDGAKQLFVDPALSGEITRALEERDVVQGFEFEAYRKDRGKIWLSLNMRLIRDEKGAEVYREGTIVDITARKRSEAERLVMFEMIQGSVTTRGLDEFLKLVHNSIGKLLYAENCFVGLYDETTKLMNFEYWADQFDSIPPPHPPGKGFSSYILRTNQPLLLDDELKDKMYVSGEAEMKGRSSASWLGVPLGRSSHAIGVLVVQHYQDKNAYTQRDLEFLSSVGNQIALAIERKQAEQALRDSEERYRDLVENAHDLIYEHDLEGNYISVNKEVEQITGYSLEESLQINQVEILAPGYIEKSQEMLRRKLAGERVTAYEMEIIAKDGHRVAVEVNSSLVLKDGVPVGVRGIARDITERKRAEEGLRESEERYRLLFESNPQPMWVYDLQTLAFLAVNESAVHHYGYSREDFLAMTIKDIRPAEDMPGLYDSVVRNSEVVDSAGTWRHLKKDGTIIEVEITSHLLMFADRRAELILAHDITERRQAEEALRESEARKRAILESSMDCIITMDHEGRIVDWNPAAEKTFAYTQEEAIGREMAMLIIPPRFRVQHRKGLARYLATGKAQMLGQRIELSAERRDGTEFPIELTITRIESKGAPMFTGYLRDITARKKAENRLSAQYAVTRALAESNTIGEGAPKILQAVCESLGWEYGSLWTVDRGANVLRCSETWQALGAEADEFESASRESVFALGIGLPGRVWKDSQPVWIADVIEDKNFSRFAIAERAGLHGGCAFPIRFRSEILGVVEFFSRSIREPDTDLLAMMVTIGSQIGQFIERKRVEEALGESEEQLRQSQKLEAIGQLAGGVAHDFNNLLTVIGGYSSLLLGKLPQDSPHRPGMEEIKKASDRASALTRQLLAFSRKQILQPKVLDFNIVVDDLENLVRRLIGEDIDLLTIPSPVLGKVKADPGQMEQVLLNLIVNARDAMPKGGKLTIETRNVVLSEDYAQRHATQPGRYVMLAVSDTGCGMDAAILPRVFEPFFTTKGSGKGTGLGLATVYGIVKQSGGNIWVYSEVGRGSTFKVYLPRVDEVAEGEAVVAAQSVPFGSELVLLVEDEEQVRAILKQILEGQGYQVLSASNGEEALLLSQDLERDIKLMITDVVMPQMSGRELAQRVLVLRPSLPVLFMSGYTDDAIVRHGLLDEKLNFMQKPFDSASVARKVREVLDSHL